MLLHPIPPYGSAEHIALMELQHRANAERAVVPLPHPDDSAAMAAALAKHLFHNCHPSQIRDAADPFGGNAEKYGYPLVYAAAVIALGPESPEAKCAHTIASRVIPAVPQ